MSYKTMTMRIAILAACASTLVLAQADFALASYSAASESRSPASSTDVRPAPAIVLAQSAIVTTRSNIKRPTKRAESGSALGAVSTTRGRKVQAGAGGTKKTLPERKTGGTLPQLR